MDTILQDLIGALADATDCKGMGYVLKNIRQHLLETDSTSWDYVVDEVISRINEIAKLKREKYIEGPNHKPYYIASGKEADLLYIASVLTDHLNGNPAYIMKALSFLSSMFLEGGKASLSHVYHCEDILNHILSEFTIMNRPSGIALTMVFPRVVISSGVECFSDEDSSVWAVSATSTDDAVIESFSYEAVAMLLDTGESVPDEAIALLEQTCSPEIRMDREEDQFGDYICALKLGLSYLGPYSDLIADQAESEKYGKIWHDYIIGLQQ